ncbi:hypothetical protein AALB_2933 [Agarivorans albus MKT 106]|uniref:Uncharacterized protein n=1 Tax=Agarivorans albus MKT 106 TaxID=1331007 RepID=R9PNL8_AGAAL|nr:hypothetical protein AALB_2933 [Agarivorans albus MKT 106]
MVLLVGKPTTFPLMLVGNILLFKSLTLIPLSVFSLIFLSRYVIDTT